jgi:hypothetical protein
MTIEIRNGVENELTGETNDRRECVMEGSGLKKIGRKRAQ